MGTCPFSELFRFDAGGGISTEVFKCAAPSDRRIQPMQKLLIVPLLLESIVSFVNGTYS
jgi:hypothetical protein